MVIVISAEKKLLSICTQENYFILCFIAVFFPTEFDILIYCATFSVFVVEEYWLPILEVVRWYLFIITFHNAYTFTLSILKNH